MVSFTFEFDKPDRKYKAGDTVHCQIIVNNMSKFKARSFSIRFKGIAHTEWTKSRTVTRNGKTTTVRDRYTGNEEYFRSYQYIFGSQNSSSDHEVLEGTNVYSSSFTLPHHIPTSFEASDGHIRYDVKAKYDISWGFDKESSGQFFVTSGLDLNEFPHLLEPVKEVEQKSFGCCCCESEPMQLINLIPKSGFVPGDTIPVTIRVDNGSDVRIEYVRVKLKEIITFTTRSPRTDTRTITNTINEHFFQTAVEPFQNKVFQTTFYLDPSFDWKLFNGCGIINASYYIKSEAEASGCHSNPDNTTGITVGTIPLNELPPINGHNNGYQAIPVFNPTRPNEDHDVIMEQPLPSYNEAARAPTPVAGASGGIGWNVGGLVSPSGAPMASTEKVFLDDIPPPSFEDSQKSPTPVGKYGKEIEAGESVPSAPAEHNPTAPPQ